MDTYTVQAGDNLTGISKSTGVGMNDILKANPSITNPNLIFSGHQLSIPRGQQGQPAAPAVGTGYGTNPQVPIGTGVATTPPPAVAPPTLGDATQNGINQAGPGTPTATTADPEQATKEAVAKELGYPDFASFAKETLNRPGLDTEKLYNDAYTAQGLPDVLNRITSKRDALNKALGVVNDNPWYDEAFRRGEASRLQNLAGNDIKNLEGEYNLRLGHVHDLVTREGSDFAANNTAGAAKLNYLHQRISADQTQSARDDANSTKVELANLKAQNAKVQTATVGTNGKLYQVDPVTHQFKLVANGNPPVFKPGTPKGSKAPTTTKEDKIVANFGKAIANKGSLIKAGTREQFGRQLQAQFPQIKPDDIQRKIYEVYKDNYLTQ